MGQSPSSSQERPATDDELITYYAKQHGVAPSLALAVARRESSMNRKAVGDGGKAIGLFQLHEAAGQDAGITDRNDPTQNIIGGVKYLRQLNDRYQGDVSKTLQAYNGGSKWVDEGKVSPQAQAYAAEVIASLSQQTRQGAAGGGRSVDAGPAAQAPTGRGGMIGPGPAPSSISTEMGDPATFMQSLAQPYSPYNPEGRQNLAAMAGEVAGMALTRGMPVGALTTRVMSVLMPVLGAGTAAASLQATEETLGTVEGSSGSVTSAGLTQGAMGLGGQALVWPARHLARAFSATQLAPHVAKTLKTEAVTQRASGRAAVDSIRADVDDVMRTLRDVSAQKVGAAQGAATGATRQARQSAVERLASIELDNAAQLAATQRTYNDLLSQSPSLLGTGQLVADTLQGPTKRALDLAGKRVAEAAATGPPVSITPVVEALNAMAAQARPASIFGKEETAAQGIGFLRNVQAAGRQAAASTADSSPDRLNQAIAQALGIPVEKMDPRLPGILGRIQQLKGEIPFEEAHQIKGLLDEAVNWDRTAKKHLERITKGLRQTLRESMSGHADYDAATAAYQAVVPLYRKGVGKTMLRLADTPDGAAKLSLMLKGDDPARAITLRQLLLDQAEAGGDRPMGQQAWNAVRAAYTHEELLAGGIDKLSKRLDDLTTLRPEFVRIVYGDQPGGVVLGNLAKIADAYKTGVEMGAERVAQSKAAGGAATATTREAGEQSVRATRTQTQAQVTEAARTGRQQVDATRRAASDANRAVTEKTAAFKDSTLGKFASRSMEGEMADVGQAALRGGSWYGLKSIARLLQAPNAADVLEWAAYSNYNTGRLTRALTSPIAPEAAAALIREMVGVATGNLRPQASHATAPSAAPSTP